MRRTLAFLLALVAGAAGVGCSDRPKAPALVTEAVYQNDKIGLRFLVPPGWTIASRADLPSGPLPKPITLVSYFHARGEYPAELEVIVAELPADADWERFVTELQIGKEKWTPQPPPSTVTLNGVAAPRYVLKRGTGKGEVRREATVFRRGERVYFFLGTFSPADTTHRDQVRKALESVAWSQ